MVTYASPKFHPVENPRSSPDVLTVKSEFDRPIRANKKAMKTEADVILPRDWSNLAAVAGPNLNARVNSEEAVEHAKGGISGDANQRDEAFNPICTSIGEAFSICAGPSNRFPVMTARSTDFPTEM